VFLGRTPTIATIEFPAGTPDRWVSCSTDENGTYNTVLFEQAGFARITPSGSSTFSLERIEDELQSDTELDFHLGAAFLDAEIRAEDTQEVVAGAEVRAGGVAGSRRGSSYGMVVRSDARGTARLGPLRPGTISLRVRATGYSDWNGEVTIADKSPEALRVLLRPEGDVGLLRLLLPSGATAGGARVAVFASMQGTANWTSEADASGLARVPSSRCCVLGVAHPQAGLLFVPWPSQDGARQQDVTLPAAAAPLRVAAVEPDESPVPWVHLRLWLNGTLVGPDVLSFLLRKPPVCDAFGLWVVKGLPRASIELVGWRNDSSLNSAAAAGLLDGPRLRYSYPWPDLIRVQPSR
jgi:hypothetical protein